MNRFKYAYYAENSQYTHKYNAYIYNYDRNGNIGRLIRYGENPYDTEKSRGMDYLKYTYDNGNQLTGVKDYYNYTTSNNMGGFVDKNTTGDDYTYDVNGNMTTDKNKHITSIHYNHLNLPKTIHINGGTIAYVYDATGIKQKKTVSTGTTTAYAGNYVYEDNGSGDELKFFSQPEGYIEPTATGFDYVYQYKDHLGNVRLSYSDTNKDGAIATPQGSVVFSDGFERASGWDGSGNSWGWPLSAFDASFKRTGNYSGRIEPTGNAKERVSHSNEWVAIDNSEPTAYRYSGWVFLENIYPNRAQIYLFMKTNEETGYSTQIDYQATSTRGHWVFMEKTVTVPAHIKKLNLRLDNDRVGKVWFDDLRIEKIGESEIVEESNYYPFGLKHKDYNNIVNPNGNSVAQKFGFGGKELEEGLGYNMHDFDMRHYDPAIARWVVVDPLAEQMRRHSPYNYAFNNPIFFIDPDGMAPISSLQDPIFNKSGKLIGDDGKTDGKIHIVYNNKQAKSIAKETKSGNTAINLTGKDVVTLHGGEDTVNGVISSVEAQGRDTSAGAGDAGLHEEGGNSSKSATTGEVTTEAWTPGAKKTGTDNATVQPFKGVTHNPSPADGVDMWHAHTSGAINGTDPTTGTPTITSAKPGPSPADKANYTNMSRTYNNLTAIQVDTRGTNRVNFYNGSGTITSIKYRAFKKLKQ